MALLEPGRISRRKIKIYYKPCCFFLVPRGSLLPAPGCRNAWVKAITVHICCLENGTMSLATGRNVVFILCLLPRESHPPRTSQTPDTRCLPPPDTRWLPLFAFPSRPFGPLPVPARRFQSPAFACWGRPSPQLPGPTSHWCRLNHSSCRAFSGSHPYGFFPSRVLSFILRSTG